MKKLIGLTAAVSALALCLGIAAMVSPVQAAIDPGICAVELCTDGMIYHNVCCPEYLPINPRCKGSKCPREWVLVCVQEPCFLKL